MYTNSSFQPSYESFASWYHEIFYNRADPRVRDKWLMGDPLPIVLFYSFYIVLITYILPKYMKNRKPLNVEKPAIMLNVLIFFVNLYFVIVGTVNWLPIFNFRCQPLDLTESRIGLLVSSGLSYENSIQDHQFLSK